MAIIAAKPKRKELREERRRLRRIEEQARREEQARLRRADAIARSSGRSQLLTYYAESDEFVTTCVPCEDGFETFIEFKSEVPRSGDARGKH